MVNRRVFLGTMTSALLASPLAAYAQPIKVVRVGVLLFGTPDVDAFPVIRRGLGALGYVEGRDVRFEIRSANEDFERLPDLAADLVRSGADLAVDDLADTAGLVRWILGET